tara:strand:+ start:951 stop:1256 length:306 start_codon:yes stop_codon:yes gene_type:complete
MSTKKAYETKDDYDDYMVDMGTTHSLLAMYLIDKGVATTRANDLALAIKYCFGAITPLDERNLKICSELLPEMFTLAKFYNDVYGDGTYPFHRFVKNTKEV